MLRGFRVANHKSIRDEQELLLVPAYDKSRPVVPVAGIFGANASGKSNLLDALTFMHSAVRGSFAQWEAGSGVPRTSFKLDPKLAAKPSLFTVDLLLGGIQYEYGFKVNSERVLAEWLYSYPHRRRRVIFERDLDSIAFGSTVPDYRGRSELMEDLTRDNALVLSSATQANQEMVAPVYDWFRRAASGLRHGGSRSPLQVLGPALQKAIEKAIERRRGFVDLVRHADLGITDITIKRPDAVIYKETAAPLMFVEAKFATDPFDRLVFHHGAEKVQFGAQEESKGTLTWLRLLLDCTEVLDNGGIMYVDEIDSSLHPHLTSTLVNLFRDDDINRRGAQLIFTTHDATLLDDEILSRDEIWFVEKDPDEGTTRLYPLTDFHPRKNENTQGRYLAGSYGAVPVLAEHRMRAAVKAGESGHAAA
jgi:hypothetical protein